MLTLLVLSNYYEFIGSYKRLPLMERAISVAPFCRDARVWFHYGQALERSAPFWLSKEPTSNAVVAYRTAAELDLKHAESSGAYARCMNYMLPQPHVIESIEAAWRQAIKANPAVGHYHYALGKLLAYGPCRPAEAADLYERGLSLCERHGHISWQWYELACIYHDKLGRNDDAERAVLVALDLQPEIPVYTELLVAIRGAKAAPSEA